jgi:hypothetical protein
MRGGDNEETVQKYFYPLNRTNLSTCPWPSGRWTDDPRKNGVKSHLLVIGKL